MVTFQEMGPRLDQYIGKPMSTGSRPIADYFVRRDLDDQTYELVSRRPDECNYVLSVRTVDGVVTGWRYLSNPPPTGCRFQHVRQLM